MNIGIVSIYPPPASKHAKAGGVASYTKNLVSSFDSNVKVSIFANKLNGKILTSPFFHVPACVVSQ